jgi:hypothetical protein
MPSPTLHPLRAQFVMPCVRLHCDICGHACALHTEGWVG